MRLKTIFCLFLLFVFNFFAFSINPKSYNKLSDRDRILLSISYFEVADQYKKNGKSELAKQYYNLALQIEKNVSKYISGELTIPQKTIKIDWDSIYQKDATTDTDKTEKNDTKDTQVKSDTEKQKTEDKKVDNISIIKKNADSFIQALISKDSAKAVSYFSNQILIENENISISGEELKETIKGWFEVNPNFTTKYEIFVEKISEKTFQVSIKFENEIDFFISLNKNSLVLKTTNVDNNFLFDTIVSFNMKEENKRISQVDINETSNEKLNDGDVKKVIPTFISNVLKNQINLAMDYFQKDVWFEEYKLIITKNNIEEYLKEWQKQYSNIENVDDVIKKDSIKEYNDNSLFQEWKLDLSEFSKIAVEFVSDPIVPGNPSKNIFVFVIEKTNLHPLYKIVAVAQTQK
ncbi:MAG TPA: hypothetical protein PK771_12110 [Spirochaetota bacterium]|nr:hypothetical protein [Spirochaetota bacterium]